jgi:hypothetical protein
VTFIPHISLLILHILRIVVNSTWF